MDREWLLVTGPTHGGTRLLVRVLSRHPEIAAPDPDVLSVASDYPWLHNLFIQAVDRMGLHEAQAPVDPDELRFVLEAYEQACSEGRYCLVKLPNYPGMAREAFEAAVDLEAVVYTSRDSEKILASKRKRGKDVRHVDNRSTFLFQTKKCLPEDRKRVLNARDFETLHEAQMDAFWSRIEAWEAREGSRLVELTAEDFVDGTETLEAFLEELGLSTEPAEAMTEVVDPERLNQAGPVYQVKERGLRAKNWLRAQLEEHF